ncbi:MAG: DNA-directed RNA polymerase subunit beta', partial [Gemmataceae bacterium]|nr:DNA-directed RNA polymerase subunit beta' [Gemmataceae bacterium]
MNVIGQGARLLFVVLGRSLTLPLLQQAVNALFDNGGCRRPVCDRSDRRLRSLTDRLQVGPGRLRGSLAGKRVDYSARSVAVPGPELALHQCGLPLEMALELYRPFVLGWLIEYGSPELRERARELAHEFRPNADPTPNWPAASQRVKEIGAIVWTALAEVMKGRPVLLSRSPVIERARLQAFEPVLTEGKAVRVHPLVCGTMGFDFDGDQVAVHLPLSIEAQVEATVMTPTTNLFSPANGNPIVAPSRDIVLGCYYLTANRGEDGEAVEAGDGMVFHSPAELFHAHAEGKLGLHANVQVRLPIEKKVISEVRDEKGIPRVEERPRKPNGLVRTTVGRVIFNDILHPKMAFYDLSLSNKYLGRVIADCYELLGARETVALLDRIKTLGFREAARSGMSLATSDLITPENKATVLLESDKQVQIWNRYEERGIIGPTERYNKVIDTWVNARDQV